MDATGPSNISPELEMSLGRLLDGLADRGVLALHDRLVPGSSVPVDHIAVAASGVWTVAERPVRGSARATARRTVGGPRLLVVNGHDRSAWVNALGHQLCQVRRATAAVDLLHVPVHGAVCLVDAALPFRQRQVRLADAIVTWPRALRKQLLASGPVDDELRAHLHQMLDRTFVPAV